MKKHIQAKLQENRIADIVPCVSHASTNVHHFNIEPPLPPDPPPNVSNTTYGSKNLSNVNYEENSSVRSSGHRRTNYLSYNVDDTQSHLVSSQNELNEENFNSNTVNGYYNDYSYTHNTYSYSNGDQYNYMYNNGYGVTQEASSNNAYKNHNEVYSYYDPYINYGPSTSTNISHFNGFILSPPPPPPPEEPKSDVPDTSSFPSPSSSNNGSDNNNFKNMPSTSKGSRNSANTSLLSFHSAPSTSSNQEWKRLEPLQETTIAIPDVSDYPSPPSSSNGLEDIFKNMPSTSKGITFADVINLLSQTTSNSYHQDYIKTLEQSILQRNQHNSDSDERFVKKCNNCEFTEFRLQFKKEKIRDLRLEREDLNRKIALLDKKSERINNALHVFGNMTETSNVERQDSGFNPKQDLKKLITKYLDHVCSKMGRLSHLEDRPENEAEVEILSDD